MFSPLFVRVGEGGGGGRGRDLREASMLVRCGALNDHIDGGGGEVVKLAREKGGGGHHGHKHASGAGDT